MNNKGFTLIELITIIFIMLVVLGLGIGSLGNSMDKRQEEADEMSIFQLNDATESYALVCGYELDHNSSNFVFSDCMKDGELNTELMIDKLMENGYLIARPKVETRNAEFKWDTAKDEWKLVIN